MCFVMSLSETKLKLFVVMIIVLTVNGKKTKKPLPSPETQEDFEANVHCKNISRLISFERADEIYVVDTFVNESILLQCKYCEERDNGLPKIWTKQKHIFSGNITEVEPNLDYNSSSVFISRSHSLIFRHVQERDLGLYFCKAPYIDGPEKSFNYLLDFANKTVDDVRGTNADLKNYTLMYISSVTKTISNWNFSIRGITVKMKVFTDWSGWSECDSCFRKDGIKYRIGRCRVKPFCVEPKACVGERASFKGVQFNDKQNTEIPVTTEDEVADEEVVNESVLDYGVALSCRSSLLRRLTPDIYGVTSRIPNFVLSGKCSAPCKGTVLKKGPRYRKSIILARGAHLTLVCPDSTIDSEVRWEHNKRRLYPNEGADYIPVSKEPRLYVDSFNTLYLFEVTDRESGNFTCFVNGLRMQEVKILVLTRSLFFTKEFTRHLKYLGFVFLICFVIYVAGVIIMCVKSHSEKKKSGRKNHKESERLIKKQAEYDSETP